MGQLSQFTRDARIAMIYEGANGVQALTSLGPASGAGWRQTRPMAFFDFESKTSSRKHRPGRGIRRQLYGAVKAAAKDLQSAGMVFHCKTALKNPNNALSGRTTSSCICFGHVCLGLDVAKMGLAAKKG